MSLKCTKWEDLGYLLPYPAGQARPLYLGEGHCILNDYFSSGDGRVTTSDDYGKTWSSRFVTIDPTILGIPTQSIRNMGGGHVYGCLYNVALENKFWYSDDYCATFQDPDVTTDMLAFWAFLDLGGGYSLDTVSNLDTGENLYSVTSGYGMYPITDGFLDPLPVQGAPYAGFPPFYGIGLGGGYGLLSWYGGNGGPHATYYTEDYGATWTAVGTGSEFITDYCDLGNGKVLGVSTIGGLHISPRGSYGQQWDNVGYLWGGGSKYNDGQFLDGVHVGNGVIYATGWLSETLTGFTGRGILTSNNNGEPGSWQILEVEPWKTLGLPTFPLAWGGGNLFLAECDFNIYRSDTGGQSTIAPPAGFRGGLSIPNKPIIGAGRGARIPYGTQIGGRRVNAR